MLLRTMTVFISASICLCGFAAEKSNLRKIPLEAKSLSGCYIENNTVKLHDRLPSQVGSENIVLEAEDALNLYFQEDVYARKSGQKADQLIQIKKSADDYTPQSDKTASGGKYIDYCADAAFQFNVEAPGKYYVWARHWVPRTANWGYYLQIGKKKKMVSLTGKIPAARTWFWIECFPVELDKGSHSLSVSYLMNGKRLDEIVLTRDKNWKPGKGPVKASPVKRISAGTVIFKPVMPVGFLAWDKLEYKVDKPGNFRFYAMSDSGKTWLPLKNKKLAQIKSDPKNPLGIKLELKRMSSGSPELSAIKAIYKFDNKSFIILENKHVQLLFSRRTGGISGIVNKQTGTACQPVGIKTNMFDLLLKQLGNSRRIWLSQNQAKLVKAVMLNPGKAQMTWTFPEYSIKVIFEVSLADSPLAKWDVTVVNNNKKYDVLEVEAPKLAELRISTRPEDDMLVWPFSAGEFVKFPASRGEHSIAYPDHAGLAYVDLYNSREGFYFGCHDPFLAATHFIRRSNLAQNAIELSINRKHRIQPGTSRTYHFAIAAHSGDWHRGARFYRNYFYSQYPVNRYRPWLRECDAWMVGSGSGHGGFVSRAKDYTNIIKDYKRAAFLALPYIQSWGSIFNGACPTFYLPRLDKGGEKLFVKMVDIWRKAGGRIGYYYHGNSVTPYYLLTKKYFTVGWDKYPEELHPPTWEWFIRNKEYTSENSSIDKQEMLKKTAQLNAMHQNKKLRFKHGNQEESLTGYMPMSWRSNAFPDYLKKWIRIYVKKYHCCTAYLDTFAFRNERPDFNPHLKLHGEGDKPMYKMKFLKSLIGEMRKSEPGFCVLTEGIADVFGTYLYFLLSGFARNPNIFRYTIPDQIIFQGNCNGLWAKPLSHKSLTQSFMLGNRLDYSTMFSHSYHILRLRQRVSPFLNFAQFDDNVGISVSSPDITAYCHLILPGTEKFVPDFGTKAVIFTLGNPYLEDAELTYELPAGFNPAFAYSCNIYKNPVKLEFERSGSKVSIKIPRSETSCVILAEVLKGPHRWTAIPVQADTKTVELGIFNYSRKPAGFIVNADLEGGNTFKVTVPGGELKTVKLSDPSGNTDFKLVKLKVSSGNRSRDYITCFGENKYVHRVLRPEEYTPPRKKKKSGKVSRDGKWEQVLYLDFEGPEYDGKAPFRGKRCFKLTGNGKYKMWKLPLHLDKNTKYRISLAHRKGFDVSLPGHNCNVNVANYTPEKRLEIYSALGLSTPRDNKWHTLAGTFKTTEGLDNCGLYLYNKKSKGNVWIDEVKIEKYVP